MCVGSQIDMNAGTSSSNDRAIFQMSDKNRLACYASSFETDCDIEAGSTFGMTTALTMLRNCCENIPRNENTLLFLVWERKLKPLPEQSPCEEGYRSFNLRHTPLGNPRCVYRSGKELLNTS